MHLTLITYLFSVSHNVKFLIQNVEIFIQKKHLNINICKTIMFLRLGGRFNAKTTERDFISIKSKVEMTVVGELLEGFRSSKRTFLLICACQKEIMLLFS